MTDTAKIELHLTQGEIDALEYALGNYTDEGPAGEGWKSDELREVCNKVDQAIGEVREGKQPFDKPSGCDHEWGVNEKIVGSEICGKCTVIRPIT